MGWLSQFLLGRPGNEVVFDVNPAAMDIEESPIVITQRNLAGDLKKSYLKVSAPTIKITSTYLIKSQRDLLASLVGVADTFLSFQTRDDWQVVNELATVIDLTHLQIANTSASRLDTYLNSLSQPAILTITTPFTTVIGGSAWGSGFWGGGVWGGAGNFDPGAITYDRSTRIITLTNPLPSLTTAVYITYTYKGWLVHMEKLAHKAQGGWIDRFTYDFSLIGA